MGHYRHLGIEERGGIVCMRRQDVGMSEIARRIGRDKSPV